MENRINQIDVEPTKVYARMYKKIYNSFLEEGFTKKQSMGLVTRMLR